MKAYVTTLHSVCNYGTQLQTFATQEKLKEYFDKVEIVDWRRKDTYGIDLLRTFSNKSVLKGIAAFPTILFWKYRFGSFLKMKISLTERLENIDEINHMLSKQKEQYCLISGSDQVWNSEWNNGILKPYYLDFKSSAKRYSYASSFGREYLFDAEIRNTKHYFNKFDKISVREDSGVDIFKNQFNIDDAVRILDPTLAMPASFWREHSSKRRIKEKYILIYNLKSSERFDRIAKEIARKKGYKLYRFCTRFDQIRKCGHSIIIPPIFDFISLIDNAELVVTDSFHATAFSTMLNTDFVDIYPDRFTNRISEFLNIFGLESRHINDENDLSVLNDTIDWDKVNDRLASERINTDNYLKMIKEGNK